MDALFGTEMPLALRFIIAFVIVLALIVGAFYLLRRFGAAGLGASATRGRQPRLAVIDAAAVDGRRRLVLIRRDNVEHLIMIGGPSDVVVEANIVRAGAAAPAREMPPPRGTGMADALPRAVPLPEGNMWPLQPEAAPRPPRGAPAPEEPRPSEPALRPAPEVAPRIPHGDRLAGLATDLSRSLQEPEPTPPQPRRASEPRRAAPAGPPPLTPSEDQNLAEMAHRLEAALRRQSGEPPVATEPAAKPAMAEPRPAPEPAPRIEPKVEAKPEPKVELKPEPKPESKPAPKPPFDSLEQEMASLLGRPSAGKS